MATAHEDRMMTGHLTKLVMAGDSKTGKSLLLQSFMDGALAASQRPTQPTIGVDFSSRLLTTAEGSLCPVQIWDTSGDPRFRPITGSYFRGAGACMLCFSVFDRESFENVDEWADFARSCGYRRKFVVAGVTLRRKEHTGERAVMRAEAMEMAWRCCGKYFEVDPFTGIGVHDAYEAAVHIGGTRTEVVENHAPRRRRALAMAMSLHPRLGADSPMGISSQFVIQTIAELLPVDWCVDQRNPRRKIKHVLARQKPPQTCTIQ